MPVRRHTFVVHIHEPDGLPTLENARTRERVVLRDLESVAATIRRWLRDAAGEDGDELLVSPPP